MEQKSFYLDTCIWLNLFKKEGNPEKGIPYWKLAKDFIEKVIFSENSEIIYSGVVIKEIKFKLDDEEKLKEKLSFLEKENRFRFVKLTEEDYYFARKLESNLRYQLSFYDCLHIALCKRLNFILVTRDKYLIKIARKHITAERPEDLFI
ncbi:MAG: PIN domain-containing protein [Candidatus Nanoarchaeia archaeon]|nr:PIN domain-containing protein [Candidatus Nanoarchaeia archaeon]